MDPLDPIDAQHIVAEYARMLERDIEQNRHPARVDSLPYAKSIIETAIGTCVRELARSNQLTRELSDYLESAYIMLAEYLDGELVALMTQYRESADRLEAGSQLASEKTRSAAWQTLLKSGSLAGEVARATALEAERLRSDFRALLMLRSGQG